MEFPDFAWASGEECSNPTVLHEGRVVRVDELETTGHLALLDTDLAQAASLGIGAWRYGMPWHRVEVEPGVYDWSLWDRALAGCERHGLRPVVDLCHFGMPDHYHGFCDPSWVEGFIRYVEAFLARYPEPRWFTPVNEPSVTAAESGMFGLWNDRQASIDDFATALAACILADLEAATRIRDDRGGWNVTAEAFLVPVVSDPARQGEADELAAHWLASWDLRLGHPFEPAAEATFARVDSRLLDRIAALATREHVIAGHDFYPTSVLVYGDPGEPLTLDARLDAYTEAARRFHARYGIDFWVAETSNLGLPVEDGPRWLEGLAARLGALRSDGLPVRGLCWYSRGDQHDWQHGLVPPLQEVTEVGLFDLARRPRPVAEVFRRLASGTPLFVQTPPV